MKPKYLYVYPKQVMFPFYMWVKQNMICPIEVNSKHDLSDDLYDL